jgi:glycosyltransferase involved in cell wall biosynthesis
MKNGYWKKLKMSNNNHLIIATGPHGFAGASQILCQTLREFHNHDISSVFVGAQQPFLYRFQGSNKVIFKSVDLIQSNAIGDDRAIQSQDVLLIPKIASKIVEIAKLNNCSSITIWGTYLIPYGLAALLAKELLHENYPNINLWITPTGSDIWEVGEQFYDITKHILNNPQINAIITYTDQFAAEIKAKFSVNREIKTIYPILDFNRFHPVDRETKQNMRSQFGIPLDNFVISAHSNMRPVKSPQDLVYISSELAKITNGNITLLLIGPKIDIQIPEIRNFSVMQLGVIDRVEMYLWISDVELNCSWHDSFNLSLAEAMACGLPLVTTDVVGIGKEIQAGECGFLFPYESISPNGNNIKYQSAINFLLKLLNSIEIREQMGENSSLHARNVFDSEKITLNYLKLL